MKGFFSDTPLARFVSKLGDLIILNMCYVVCCLPVITIGAANAALYAVSFREGTDRERSSAAAFFRLFRSSLKKGTLAWLAVLLMAGGMSSSAWLLFCSRGALHYGFIPMLVLTVLLLMTAWYVFALVGLFDNDVPTTFKNGVLLCIGYLPKSLLILLVNWLPVILFFTDPRLSLWATWLWTFLYFALASRFNARLARNIFAPYLPWQQVCAGAEEE